MPYPPESAASGVGDPAHWNVVWYERDVDLPHRADDGIWLLHFGAVDHRAQVWVDGELRAGHEGGHTPFSVPLRAREQGRRIQITVRAEDRSDDLSQPRGKQDCQDAPHAIWYSRTSGIWQPVSLERVPARTSSGSRGRRGSSTRPCARCSKIRGSSDSAGRS